MIDLETMKRPELFQHAPSISPSTQRLEGQALEVWQQGMEAVWGGAPTVKGLFTCSLFLPGPGWPL